MNLRRSLISAAAVFLLVAIVPAQQTTPSIKCECGPETNPSPASRTATRDIPIETLSDADETAGGIFCYFNAVKNSSEGILPYDWTEANIGDGFLAPGETDVDQVAGSDGRPETIQSRLYYGWQHTRLDVPLVRPTQIVPRFSAPGNSAALAVPRTPLTVTLRRSPVIPGLGPRRIEITLVSRVATDRDGYRYSYSVSNTSQVPVRLEWKALDTSDFAQTKELPYHTHHLPVGFNKDKTGTLERSSAKEPVVSYYPVYIYVKVSADKEPLREVFIGQGMGAAYVPSVKRPQ